MKTVSQFPDHSQRHLLPILTMFLFVLLAAAGYSQMTVISGTKVNITGSTMVNSTRNVALQLNGTINLQGTLILKQNMENQNTAISDLGPGTVVFSGTTGQSISGQNVIQNLEVANGSGLTLAGNTTVNGILSLTSGQVILGGSNLVLGPAAVIAGTPSAASMVVPTAAGRFQKEFSAAGTFLFPVGDATGTPEYSPVTLEFTNGTFAAGNRAGVSLVDASYPGTETSYLSRYWTITQSGITGFSCNASFTYPSADVVGTESDIFSFKVDPALPWVAYNAANVSTHQLSARGLSSFGTFTGNVGNAAVPPDIRSLQDKTISGGSQCADAAQTLLIAGNGTSYLVTASGSVEHIAGTNIIYYPGTKVVSGGYMHGHISTIFCNPAYAHPGAEAPALTGTEQPGQNRTDNSFFRIYPNPTPGNFTVELSGDAAATPVHVEIFGVLGDRILSKDLLIERKQEFSLIDKPSGIYIIHLSAGTNSETEKIIKR